MPTVTPNFAMHPTGFIQPLCNNLAETGAPLPSCTPPCRRALTLGHDEVLQAGVEGAPGLSPHCLQPGPAAAVVAAAVGPVAVGVAHACCCCLLLLG